MLVSTEMDAIKHVDIVKTMMHATPLPEYVLMDVDPATIGLTCYVKMVFFFIEQFIIVVE